MNSKKKLFVKRLLIALATTVICGVVFVLPCISSSNSIRNNVEHESCDGSCSLSLVQEQLISQQNWEFVLPGLDWTEIPSPISDIKIIIESSNPNNLVKILFIKQEINESFSDYVIETIRSLAPYNITELKQVTINDRRFLLIKVLLNNKMLWSWVTVEDKFGYNFACSLEINTDSISSEDNLCLQIAETVKVR